MNLPSAQDASPIESDWLQVARRIEQAQHLQDPLMAVTWLSDLEDEVKALVARPLEDAVRRAREVGKTWAELATATGVKDRQTAWRRWTDRGID